MADHIGVFYDFRGVRGLGVGSIIPIIYMYTLLENAFWN